MTSRVLFISLMILPWTRASVAKTPPQPAVEQHQQCDFLLGTLPTEAVIVKIHDQLSPVSSLSCAAHAAATGLENLIFVKTGKKVALSVPFLIVNAARLRFAHIHDVANGEKKAIGLFNRIQTVDQDFIFQAALKYGVVPESAWQPSEFYGFKKDLLFNLDFVFGAPFEGLWNGKFLSNLELQKSFEERLVERIGPMPDTVEFEGMSYTPKELAAKLLPPFRVKQVLIAGHESMNKGKEGGSDSSVTFNVDRALEVAAQQLNKGIAVPADFAWVKRYRHENGVWSVSGDPQKFFLKRFYHSMTIVDLLYGKDGRVEWLKVANTHGLIKHGKRLPLDGYSIIHRSYFLPYMYRLYELETIPQ